MKTEKQKNKMIKRLRDERDSMPHFSERGSNIWDYLDNVINILSGKLNPDDCSNSRSAENTNGWLNGEIKGNDLLDFNTNMNPLLNKKYPVNW